MKATPASNAVRVSTHLRSKARFLGTAPEPDATLYGIYLYEEWLPTIKLEAARSTYASTLRDVDNYIAPRLGDVSVSSLTNRMLKEFYADLLKTHWMRSENRMLSRETVVHIHATIGWSLQGLVDSDRLPANPAWGARPRARKTDRYERVAWTPEQVCHFLDYSKGDDLAPLWNVLALTGMTRGESLGLRWSDLSRGYTHVRIMRSLLQTGSSTYVKGVRARRVDLLESTKIALRSHRSRQRGRRRKEAGPVSGFVFCDHDGEPLNPDLPSRRFRKLAEAGGFTRIRLCDLRHTHATHLLQAGANIKAVQERLGHADPMFTIDTYIHMMPTIQAEAVKALTKFYGQLAGSNPKA